MASFARATVRLAALSCSAGLAAFAPAGGAPAAGVRHAAARLPSQAMHAQFVVEVNRAGQVTRVRSGTSSSDATFNTLTYGNALQAFIRTADGNAVAGVYRLTYDFSPRTRQVRRSVSLMRAGGVNASAPGAVDAMAARSKHRPAGAPRAAGSPLPDFKSITGP